MHLVSSQFFFSRKNGKMVCAAINITDEIPMDNFKELVDSIKEYRYMYTR